MRRLTTLLLALCLPIALLATNLPQGDTQTQNHLRADSKADTSRLVQLVEMIANTDHTSPERTTYIDRLIHEARLQNNSKYLCEGYLLHLFAAYNKLDSQGVNRWMKLLEPIAQKEKFYNILFQARQCTIDLLGVEGQYELQEELANQMLEEATNMGNKWGIATAHLSLASACEEVGRHHTASEHLLKAYEQAWSINNFELNCEILYNLVRTYSLIGDRKGELDYLRLFNSYVKEHRNAKNQQNGYMLLISSAYINYYIEIDDKQSARSHYQQSRLYFSKKLSNILLANYYSVLHDYFRMEKEYDQAINYIDKAITKTSSHINVKLMLDKARTLQLMGHHKMASELYKQSLMIRDSIKTTVFINQVEHLRHMHDADKLALDQERSRANKRMIIFVISLTIIVLTALVMLFMSITSMRLKKKREQMRVMAREMTNANTVKSKFMNNISHGIKEPLSQIVNQSALITSDQSLTPEVRKKLSDSVCKTADDLLVTINNILDLSRLESGMMKYVVSDDDIATTIRDVVSRLPLSASSKLTIDVPQEQEMMVTIDHGRLFTVLRTSLNFISQGKSPKLTATLDLKHHLVTIELSAQGIAASKVTQDVVISNEINRMVMEHFKGSYTMSGDNDNYMITIGATLTPAPKQPHQ